MCSEIIFYLIKKAILSGGSRPLLFLDQTEAQRADKFVFFKTGTPLSQGLDLCYCPVYKRKEKCFMRRLKNIFPNNVVT